MRTLVIDVGTSGLRAAIVHDDATVTDLHYEEFAPDSPFAGLVEFDATAMACFNGQAHRSIARMARPTHSWRMHGRACRTRICICAEPNRNQGRLDAR